MKLHSLLSTLTVALLLTGCQMTPKAPTLPSTPNLPHVEDNQQSTGEYFKITGKIGVRTPQQNGSAFYGWTQQGDQFAIDLTGAMGIGQTSIRGNAEHVTLTSSKTGTIEATTPEEPLFQATKWEAPITYLISWINAKPVENHAITQKDEYNRLISIQEGGWQATLSYNETEKLPNKLVLIDEAQQNRVTLTIQSRE